MTWIRDWSWLCVAQFGSDALTLFGKDWRIAYASEIFTGVSGYSFWFRCKSVTMVVERRDDGWFGGRKRVSKASLHGTWNSCVRSGTGRYCSGDAWRNNICNTDSWHSIACALFSNFLPLLWNRITRHMRGVYINPFSCLSLFYSNWCACYNPLELAIYIC